MPAPLIRYALDPTGTNPDNLVSGEIKTLSNAPQVRAAAPTYGPFFAESMIVYDHGTNQLLTRGVDYELLDLVEEATVAYGKEILQMILVKNTSVTGQIRLTYQVLGGLYQNNSEGLLEIYDSIMNDTRPVDWSLVVNRPSEYPPTDHLHAASDVKGTGPLVVALKGIENAIVLSNIPAFEALISWVKTYAGSTVIFDPVVNSLSANAVQNFDITTSNLPNGTKLYWTIEHNGTQDDNFAVLSGDFTLFQNRGSFQIQLSDIPPLRNELFDVLIRANGVNGDVLTRIEGITYIGSNPSDFTLADLLTSCCLYEPGTPVTVDSLYIIGAG
jgi:hypothetical protein